MTEEFRQDYCPTCKVMCESRLDLKTGRAFVGLWAKCPTREKCEQRILPGFCREPHDGADNAEHAQQSCELASDALDEAQKVMGEIMRAAEAI